jgi:hypothetical protein
MMMPIEIMSISTANMMNGIAAVRLPRAANILKRGLVCGMCAQ